MTYADIEREARLLVNDTQEPYRFTQVDIFRFAVKAVRHLRNVNRSEEYGPNGLLDSAIPEPDAETDVRIDPKHEDAVVKFVASLIYEQDMSDTVNMQLVTALRTRAEALMQL